MKLFKRTLSVVIVAIMVTTTFFFTDFGSLKPKAYSTYNVSKYSKYYFAPSSGYNYIYETGLYFSSSSNSDAESNLTSRGYTPVGHNFNAGDGEKSKYIHLGVKYGSNPSGKATAFRGYNATDGGTVGTSTTTTINGNSSVTFYKIGSNANTTLTPNVMDGAVDLNKGAGGDTLYLYVSNAATAGPPVTAISMVNNGNASTAANTLTNGGYTIVSWFHNTSANADFNEGCGGDFNYFGYKTTIPEVTSSITTLNNNYNTLLTKYNQKSYYSYSSTNDTNIEAALTNASNALADYVADSWSLTYSKDTIDSYASACATQSGYMTAKKPSVSRSTWVRDGVAGYYVYAQVDQNGGAPIARVQFPSWTQKVVNGNEQDDIQSNWSTSSAASGTAGTYTVGSTSYNYRYYVAVSAHNNEYGVYATHIYAYNTLGAQNNRSPNYFKPFVNKVTLNNQSATSAGTTALWFMYKTNSGDTYYYSNADCTTALNNGYTITCPTRTGYQFGGYWTGTGGTGTNYVNTSGTCINNMYTSLSAAENTIYAKWTANTYTVAYNANGGSGSMSSVSHTYDTAKNLTANAFTRYGYTFAGWATSASGSVAYTNGQSVTNLTSTNGATVTLYAKWTANSHNITYNLNGGSASGNPTSYTIETVPVKLNNPTKTGYTFTGWTGSNLSSVQTTAGVPNVLDVTIPNATASSPVTLNGRDYHPGSSFPVIPGRVYRVYVTAKRTEGSLNLQGGIWYTSQTSGNGYDGYGGAFTKLRDVDNGYAIYYKDVTAREGKSRGQFYIQIDQCLNGAAPTTKWLIYDAYVTTLFNNVNIGSMANYTISSPFVANNRDNHPDPSIPVTSGKTYRLYYSAKQTAGTVALKVGFWWTTYSSGTPYDFYGAPNKESDLTDGWARYYRDMTIPANKSAGQIFFQIEQDHSVHDHVWNIADISLVEMNQNDLSFTANWQANTYTVTYNANGGTLISGQTAPSNVSATYDVSFTTAGNVYEKTGYTQSGWNTAAAGNGTSYSASTSVSNLTATNGATVTLYAKWTINKYYIDLNWSYIDSNGTVDYNSGGNWATANVYIPNDTLVASNTKDHYAQYNYGTTYKMVATAATNYTIKKSDNTYASTETQSGTLGAGNAGVRFYVMPTYTIAFNGNGNTNTSVTMTSITGVPYDQSKTLTANAFERKYTVSFNTNGGSTVNARTATYTFDGWATSADGAKVYNNQASVNKLSDTPGATVTLYAHWNSGSINLPTDSDVTKTGYHVDKWYTNSGLTTLAGTGTGTYTPTSTCTLHLKWAANTYTVKYNKNGATGTETMANTSHVYNTASALRTNAFTWVGHTFAGWATSASGSVAYTDGQNVSTLTTTNNGTVELFAKWTANEYKVAFNKNGGSGSNSAPSDPSPTTLKVTYGANYPTLPTISRNYYTFDGWFTSGGTQIVAAQTVGGRNEGISLTTPLYSSGNTAYTLYAHWTAKTYTIHFDENKGSGSSDPSDVTDLENVAYDGNYSSSALPTPTRNGYTFSSWQGTNLSTSGTFTATKDNILGANGEVSTSSSTVTLKAVWTKKDITLKWNSDGGSTVASYTKKFDEAIGAL
ncbi:MAG: InlB B-repeat-containing protein, partial [Clostridiales bacterium]|nr:InlB B-repeat-containing protein [Clostridiales bacterium]